ncbi:GNAT family N-acetyltransferase [Rhizobium sp. SL42]|uniref:GNAT family N-acetyltransferase n=1 Tax=Rhizobium sp. SL42 TaxID=2806346 RepID=UPI001F3BDB11|nr:GNAT family protein [Rhizobium sp. SL42]UJW73251.1 GNAT family N-acetyltransferase [Rhizobium sp. SL42]
MPALTLRPALAKDVPLIMATERLPGYDRFIGKYSEDEHHSNMASAAFCYLIGQDDKGAEIGFVILNDLDRRDGNICIKRIAVATPEKGYGSQLLAAAVDYAYRETHAYRLWLDVVRENGRARAVYGRTGFIEEGTMRQAAVMPDGSRTDMLMMSMLRPEWAAKQSD